jgi:hypothetical protein
LELLPRLIAVQLVGETALSMSNFVIGPKRLPIRYQVAQAV